MGGGDVNRHENRHFHRNNGRARIRVCEPTANRWHFKHDNTTRTLVASCVTRRVRLLNEFSHVHKRRRCRATAGARHFRYARRSVAGIRVETSRGILGLYRLVVCDRNRRRAHPYQGQSRTTRRRENACDPAARTCDNARPNPRNAPGDDATHCFPAVPATPRFAGVRRADDAVVTTVKK